MTKEKINVKHIAKHHAYQNIPLTFDEAYALGELALEGCEGNELSQIQSIALLSALHNRALYQWKYDKIQARHHGHRLPKNAAEQIAGICAAVFDCDIGRSRFGFIRPNVEYAMDNCGMGGDLVVTANLSTIAAFIAAAAGIPMCKHGSPANADAGKHGSSDFISGICGINTKNDKEIVERCVEEHCFGYTEALNTGFKRIHLQTHQVAKLPHMNDIIGPITNPLHPDIHTRRVLGVNHLISPRLIAEAFHILNEKGITQLQHGIFVRGFVHPDRNQGMDEVSICAGKTQVAELERAKIREYELGAEDFGVKTVSLEEVTPIGNKGDYSLAILKGEINGNRANVAIANAAPLFLLAGMSDDWKKCFRIAKEIFESGKPYQKMLAIRKMMPLVNNSSIN